jgi:anti-sigma factor RsiW
MKARPPSEPLCASAEVLSSFVDGECPVSDADSIREHLRVCPVCREEVRALTALNQSLLALGREVAPPGLEARVSTRLDAARTAPRPAQNMTSRRAWLGGGIAAAAVSAILLAVPAFRHDVVSASVNDFITYRDTGWTVDLAARDGATLAAWAQSRVSFAVPEPKSTLSGLEVGGIRLCWLLNRRLIGLTYARGNDRAVLYIMEAQGLSLPPMDQPLSTGTRAAVRHVKGHGVAVWAERDLVFVLVAAEPAFDRLVTARS